MISVEEFHESGAPVHFNEPIAAGSTVCVLDSSFNPPTYAHVKLGKLCQQQYPGCVLIFSLAIGNVDKPTASDKELNERVSMIEAMILSEFSTLKDNVRLALTTVVQFVKKTLALHTVLPTAQLVFAMGYDTLVRLGYQKYYDRPVSEVLSTFFDLCQVLVLTRASDSITKMPEVGDINSQANICGSVFDEFTNRICVKVSSADTQSVSSSRARTSKENLKKLTPKFVSEYAITNNVYNLDS